MTPDVLAETMSGRFSCKVSVRSPVEHSEAWQVNNGMEQTSWGFVSSYVISLMVQTLAVFEWPALTLRPVRVRFSFMAKAIYYETWIVWFSCENMEIFEICLHRVAFRISSGILGTCFHLRPRCVINCHPSTNWPNLLDQEAGQWPGHDTCVAHINLDEGRQEQRNVMSNLSPWRLRSGALWHRFLHLSRCWECSIYK